MTERINVPSGSYLEPIIGFSRAVRIGNHVAVAGTAPIAKSAGTEGIGDIAAQTRRCLEISMDAPKGAGASLGDVIRTRLLLTNAADWEIGTRVHGEFFADIRPACTVMVVSGFVDPDWLIETEVDAIIPE